MNYFEVLNVSENAEKEVIEFAYRALAKKYHPDSSNLPKNIAAEKMTIINEAYRILSDEAERQKYVKCLHSTPKDLSGKEDLREERVRTGKDADACEDNYSKFEDGNVMSYIILIVIIVSVICCVAYFGPELLSDAWSNIVNGFEKVGNTFKK